MKEFAHVNKNPLLLKSVRTQHLTKKVNSLLTGGCLVICTPQKHEAQTVELISRVKDKCFSL